MPHCGHCGQRIPVGQARLSRSEIERFDYEGFRGFPNIIRLQVVKAHAGYYDVADWTSHVDSSLSMNENIDRMARIGDPSVGDLRRRMADGGVDGGVDATVDATDTGTNRDVNAGEDGGSS
jgi:hypothetical protein